MKEDPDIVKMLRREERLGILTGMSQGVVEELETPGDVLEDMPDKNISVMTDAVEADSLFSEDKKEWSSILDAVSDWVCLLDKNRRIIHTNLAVKKITGLSLSEIIGQNCCKITHGLDKPLQGCPFEKMLLSRKRESLKIQIPDSNRWVKATVDPVTDEKGNVVRAVHIVSDITRVKESEEKLKKSEEKYRTIFKNTGTATVIVEEDTTISLANKGFVRLSGFSREEIEGKKKWTEFVVKEDLGGMKEQHSLRRKDPEAALKNYEFRFVDKDGKVKDIFLTIDMIPGSTKSVASLLDITRRKKIEDEIKYLKEHNENILESNPNPIIVIEGDQIEYVNKSFVSTFGKTRNDYISKKLKEVIPAFEELLQDYNEKKELEIKDKSFSVSSFVVRKAEEEEEEEEEERIGIILQDITAKKKAEERTKQQNKVSILRAEIWELAAQPLSEDELIQQLVDKVGPFFNLDSVNFIRIYPEEKAVVVEVQWQNGNKSGVGVNIPLWVLKRGVFGKPYFVASLKDLPLYARPIIAPFFKKYGIKSSLLVAFGDIDNPKGYIVASDTTDRDWSEEEINVFAEAGKIISLRAEKVKAEEKVKNRQRKIEQQNIQLKKLDRIKTDFLNATSHELRTPMAAIKGYIQMLLKQTLGDVTPEQKDALNVVLRNTDRLDHLVQDILDISRLESGTMKFIPEKTDISKMIKESLQTMQYNTEMKNIKINTELGKNIPTLFIDQERIKQVIMNLVDNAIKFSLPNSTVMIRAKKDKNDVLFEVQDFGRGIPKNKQKKIFERFYQVDSGMDRKFGGVGLGLTISQNIVKSHGGNIWVDNSTTDKGSTFKFNLPIDSVENIEEKFEQMDIFKLENNK